MGASRRDATRRDETGAGWRVVVARTRHVKTACAGRGQRAVILQSIRGLGPSLGGGDGGEGGPVYSRPRRLMSPSPSTRRRAATGVGGRTHSQYVARSSERQSCCPPSPHGRDHRRASAGPSLSSLPLHPLTHRHRHHHTCPHLVPNDDAALECRPPA